jgi:predicted transcriptional regulator
MSNWLKMAEAQSILALARLGWSYRRIATEVGVDRETVSRHVKAVATAPGSVAGGLPVGEPAVSNATISITGPAVSDGTIEEPRSDGDGDGCDNVAGVGCGSNAAISIAGSGEVLAGRRSRCEPWRELIVQGLAGGLSAQRIWQDLKNDHEFADGYQSVQRFVRKLGESLPLPVRRM